jgi:hypothetical protein
MLISRGVNACNPRFADSGRWICSDVANDDWGIGMLLAPDAVVFTSELAADGAVGTRTDVK